MSLCDAATDLDLCVIALRLVVTEIKYLEKKLEARICWLIEWFGHVKEATEGS